MGLEPSPRQAWDVETERLFGAGTAAQQKGCPRGAFLGLCEAGLVEGIPPGDYTRSAKNRAYAEEAVALLRLHPELVSDPTGLWDRIVAGDSKQHNGQLDVVLALWQAGLIKRR